MVSARADDYYARPNLTTISRGNGDGWRPVTRREPCPICGQGGWCSRSDDGAVTCMRALRDSLSTAGWRTLKRTRDGAGLILRRDDGLASTAWTDSRPREQKTKPPKVAPAIWKQRVAAFQMNMGGQRAALAAALGVDEAALQLLDCGWRWECNDWTFPERNAAGDIVGVSTRLASPIRARDGKVTTKRMIRGSTHGLFYAPTAWQAGDGPILLVEGASDTAAAYTMGLAAVGRPSNTGGIRDLAVLLRDIPTSRPIVVVGENDDRDGISPGRNGARLTAERLAEETGRAILWAMPPAGSKDTRDYLRSAGRDAGPTLVESLISGATIAEPPGLAGVEQMLDRGPERDLAEWRQESIQRRIAAMRKPGLYLDRGEVGTGKTAATIEAISTTGRQSMIWLMPDHANCEERVAELRRAGIPAIAYPRLDGETCANIEAVRQTQSFGLVAGAAVCPNCPFKDACETSGYLAMKERADKSDFRVATISRAAVSDGIFKGKSFRKDGPLREGQTKTWYRGAPETIVADERVGDVLAEIITTAAADLELAHYILANVAKTAAARGRRSKVRGEHIAFAKRLATVIEAIQRAGDNVAGGGVHRVDLEGAMAAYFRRIREMYAGMGMRDVAIDDSAFVDPPNRWQVAMNEWIGGFWSTIRDLPEKRKEGFAASIRLVTLAATGRLEAIWVTGDRKPRGDAIAVTVTGKRLARLPKQARVFLLDADATIADLTARTGRRIEDITPTGHIRAVQRVRQVLLDVTKSSDPSKTARVIEAHLHESPHVRRLGVIGHKDAIDAILAGGAKYLSERHRERVAMSAGYATGMDRGSNLWPALCDDLAVIGTPRPPAARQWLVAHGEIDAAAMPDGDWGDVAWEGVTTDGGRKVFTARSYRHPAWRRAARAIHLAAIRQAAGRARAILPTGIPVTVYSDQPTGFPVDESVEAAAPAVGEAVAAFEWVAGQSVKCANSPSKYLGELAHLEVRSSAVVDRLMLTGGIQRRAAQRLVDIAVTAGRLERLSGWRLRLAAPESPPAAILPSAAASESSETVKPPTLPAIVVTATSPRPSSAPMVVTAGGSGPCRPAVAAALSPPSTPSLVCDRFRNPGE